MLELSANSKENCNPTRIQIYRFFNPGEPRLLLQPQLPNYASVRTEYKQAYLQKERQKVYFENCLPDRHQNGI